MPENRSDQSMRRLVHTRRIVCMGYERDDGLFDIEGSMVDTKGHDSDLLFKVVPTGSPIHAMRLVVTIDAQLVIRHIEAHTDVGPSRFCADINAAYGSLKGLSIVAGFMKEVKNRLAGPAGCTHLTELLGPIATTAIQTLMGLRSSTARRRAPADNANGAQTHPMVDSCYAWRAGGEVVRIVSQRKNGASQTEAQAGAKCPDEAPMSRR